MGLGRDRRYPILQSRRRVLRGLRPAHQVDPDPDDHEGREPLRLPLSLEPGTGDLRLAAVSSSIPSGWKGALMEQRFAFDPIADIYKAARPDYPEALIEDVVSYADLKQSDKILEVGCGTGQATKSFAKRNFSILAIDPGPEMLRGARESLAGFSNVEFLETTFEAWPATQGEFRLIVAAQSWHWVSAEVRFVKAAEVLSPEGSLAIFGHVPVGLPAPLLAQFKEIYLRHTGKWGSPPEAGTYRVVHSKDGLMNWGCSARSPIRVIPGNGRTRHQAIRISCARNRSIGCWSPRSATRCLVNLLKPLTITAGGSRSITKRISTSPAV